MKTLVIKPNYAETLGALCLFSCHFETALLQKPVLELSAQGLDQRPRPREGRCPRCLAMPSVFSKGQQKPGLILNIERLSVQPENRESAASPKKSQASSVRSQGNQSDQHQKNGSHCICLSSRVQFDGPRLSHFVSGLNWEWAQSHIYV